MTKRFSEMAVILITVTYILSSFTWGEKLFVNGRRV